MNASALFEKLKNIRTSNPLCHYTLERCIYLAPIIQEISALKAEKKALILAHSYVHSDIIYGVADETGDSYALAKKAAETDCSTILFSAVRFMAETAKILNPEKIVIDPNPNGGCSLADSITAEDVLRLRETYPQHTFICYINTTAAVKALCDVCVTSANVYRIVEKIDNDKIYFLPDKLMGENIKNYLKNKNIAKEFLFYSGTCYVHEAFEADELSLLKSVHPSLTVLAHPECRPEVVALATHVSSTTGMFDYVKSHHSPDKQFLMLTECGIASRLQVEVPEAHLLGSCMLCRYMKSNSLETIRQALKKPQPSQIIEIDPSIRQAAARCLHAMFSYA